MPLPGAVCRESCYFSKMFIFKLLSPNCCSAQLALPCFEGDVGAVEGLWGNPSRSHLLLYPRVGCYPQAPPAQPARGRKRRKRKGRSASPSVPAREQRP